MVIPDPNEFSMDAGTFLAGRGKAFYCQAADYHAPVPIRFVWHHILPLSCGGRSTEDNLVQVCDSCHYAIHRLMVDLLNNAGIFVELKRFARGNRANWALAGYKAAVAAGTQANLPREHRHG
jgi:hypothetical protein